MPSDGGWPTIMPFLALLRFMLNLTSIEHSSNKNCCAVSNENVLKKKVLSVLIFSPFPVLLTFRTGYSPAGLLVSWSLILHVTPNTIIAAVLLARHHEGCFPALNSGALLVEQACRVASTTLKRASICAHCLTASGDSAG